MYWQLAGDNGSHFCYRTQPESSKFTFCSGLVLHKNQARSTFGDWLSGIIEFSRGLHSMELDVSAFACLAALTLVNGESVANEIFNRSTKTALVLNRGSFILKSFGGNYCKTSIKSRMHLNSHVRSVKFSVIMEQNCFPSREASSVLSFH